jgi:multidrug efflux pump subunit AcrA (membrane-fusion protein)
VKKWLWLLFVVALIGAGGYYWWGLTGVRPLQESAVTFAEVRKVTIRDTISATGVVEPREIVLVSAELPGTIMRVNTRENTSIPLSIGDIVHEGDPLAYLDDRRIVLKVEEASTGIAAAKSGLKQAEAALAQAEASKDAADRYLDNQIKIHSTVRIRTEKDQAEAQVQAAAAGIRVAKAGIEVAKSKLEAAHTAKREADLARDLSRICVPGLATAKHRRAFVILDRKANVGQMVGPQSGPLFTLAASLDEVEVHAQVVESDVNKIAEGLKVYFKVNNFSTDGESDFEGVVNSIRPLATNIRGAAYCDAVIKVKNRKESTTGNWLLRPGMTASLDIVRHEHANAWRVPAKALDFTLEEAYQSDAVKSKLADWKKRADAQDWRPLWVWDKTTQRPTPIFIRIGAREGEIGLKDLDGNEVLEWESGREPTAPLRVIIDAPKSRPPGFFDQPANVKI